MRLRIRSSSGVKPLTVEHSWTFAHLKKEINATAIRAGYPPRSVNASDDQLVTSLFADGDVIVVAGSSSQSSTTANSSASQGTASMVIHEVPDDNSCLFCSVNFLLSRPHTTEHVYGLRQEVSFAVTESPKIYSEAFLGRPNAEYCAWILSDNAWGGAIELSILAQRYAVELAAFDLKTMRLDRYGEGNGFPKVGFLVYDGIHYNYIARKVSLGSDVTLFKVTDVNSMLAAKAIAQKQHDGKKYTDTTNFKLKCGDCGMPLKGEKQALEHARDTKHSNFSES